MKKIVFLFLIINSFTAYSQEKPEPTIDIEPYFDLKFTQAERDSMIGELESMKKALVAMHGYELRNEVMPAVLFDPIPANFSQKSRSVLSDYDIPAAELPKNRDDLAFYTVAELSSLIKNKKISSVELTRFFIDRLKTYSDTLESTVAILEDRALEQAHKADLEINKGRYRGPLHGIPYGVKDLIAVKGTKTTWGATPFKDQEIETTATIVQNLDSAGAILVAKLTLGALAMGDIWYGGKTRNPWNLEQGSSGSSAGSAAAVSAGLVPFAIGSETLGSIVSPSTRTGATGLRPTYGRVSRNGAMALSWSMDKLGPITRSAKDAALVFDVIEGKDPADPTTYRMNYSYNPVKDLSKLKIGYLKSYFERDYSNKENDQRTLEQLIKMGANLEPVNLPDSVPVSALSIILMAEAAAAFDQLTRSGLDSLLVNQSKYAWPNYFRGARFIPAVEYINANRLRRIVQNELHEIFKEYDVIVAPSFGGSQLLMTNLTGHPAVVMPNGFNDKGAPTSITFLGNLFDEGIILAFAQAYQEATEWDNKHPEFFK
ncbi:MAG: amidase [Candidatus Cyclobacteriaceae bacterium M2_1C_046]